MENTITAKIAVSSVMFGIDRPYSYTVPGDMTEKAIVGVRVAVPFGRGNQLREGIILSLSDEKSDMELKSIAKILDDAPILSDEQMKLAMWMRDRFFCTVYDAVHAMLPAGIWFKEGVKPIGDKTVSWVVLEMESEEAMELSGEKSRRAPKQSAVLNYLAQVGQASTDELFYFTNATMDTVKSLVKSGAVRIERREVFRRPEYETFPKAPPVVLNDAQQDALNGLMALSESERANCALLYGVTGSGKTLVYIELIKKLLLKDKGAIVLVPEIALTPQLVHIFSAHFGENIAIMHSSLSMGERYDEWKRVRSGKVRVVIGTRSAVFAPVKNLGAIIIDEEQEHTYKSGSSPRYHTRDVAKYRCAYNNALLLLCSATPSIESMKNARDGVYSFFELDRRFNESPLPPVIIADMRAELKNGNATTISSVLERELEKNIIAGEQSILFINRRGASGSVVCPECGHVFTCPNCSVSMTYHSANNKLMCHYCGHSEYLPSRCPECGGKLRFSGAGTQKVEEELHNIFPQIDIVRMDMDTVSYSHSHEKLLNEFRDRKTPVLLGTQMVTKGLDFENVTLIGVIYADQALYANDYRANERAFSLITQVVGRAGRGKKAGRAVIQTYTPNNEIIRLASKQDYMSFYEKELEVRKILGSPPIADIIMLTVSGADEAKAMFGCSKLAGSFKYYFKDSADIKILGPAPAAITKMSNKYRYRVYVVGQNSREVRNVIGFVMREFMKDKETRGLSVTADVNPAE